MTFVNQQEEHLIENLPDVRGKLIQNFELAKLNWFRVGGPAEVYFMPADEDDLTDFLKNLPSNTPVNILGIGSNTLIRDGGIPGVSISLGPSFRNTIVKKSSIVAGCAISNLKLANVARAAVVTGFEFLSGIPGSLGGSINMNAGAYGGEVGDIFEEVVAVTFAGNRKVFKASEMNFGYRSCNPPENCIFIEASLKARPGNSNQITENMRKIQGERKVSQPTNQPTGGSTFTNPPGCKAWELIDQAGCRGLQNGGAKISEKHCNFLINLGHATAADIEGLGEEVRRRVLHNSGINLQWEIKRIGVQDNTDLKSSFDA